MRAVLVLVLAACTSRGTPPIDPDGGPGQVDARPGAADAATTDGAPPPPDASPAPRFLCNAPPPPGAPVPVPPPLPSAGCPTLVPGLNAITSSGETRELILVLPDSPEAFEQLPVLFLWHWIGGDAEDFLEKGEVQTAATDQRFIAVIPVAKGATVFGTLDTRWPFDITQTPQRMEEEFVFFDDMLACVEAQYQVNESCVSTIGVSAGALFTDQLAQARSQRLASFGSLSGGVGATHIKPWTGATRKLPGLVLWGGDGPPEHDGVRDILGCLGIGMDFSAASDALETALVADGHFIMECTHNCGHVEPPLVPAPGDSKYASMWAFALDHPFWLPPGTSPYLTDGLPAGAPDWCGIGMNGATPRTGGGCPAAENPCAF